MSPNFIRRLGIALAVLVVVWLGLRLVRGSAQDSDGGFRMAKIDRAAVDTIVIERPSDTVRLVKLGAGWTVNGQRAASSQVDDLLAALSDSSARGEIAAENASSHQRLGVAADSAKRIVAKQGGRALATYLVGKRGSNWESAFVRVPDQNQVYLVRGRLVEMVERNIDDWRDKRIVEVSADSLTSIEVQQGKRRYVLTKSGSQWTIDGAPADSAGVAALVSQFARLDASGFASAAEADSARFDNPERTVKLVGPGGRALATLALDSTSGGFWVKRDTASTVYRIDQWTAGQLTPSDSSLRKK